MPLTSELLLLGYIQKLTLFKKHYAFFSFVSKEERASFNMRTQRHSAGQGVQSWEGWRERVSKVTKAVRSAAGAAEYWGRRFGFWRGGLFF